MKCYCMAKCMLHKFFILKKVYSYSVYVSKWSICCVEVANHGKENRGISIHLSNLETTLINAMQSIHSK